MLHLSNRELTLDILDPSDPADRRRQGWRYCHGGYVWQVHDRNLGPLLAGPSYPAEPSVFDGQGLPESFRHTRRDPPVRLTWDADAGVALGAGTIVANPAPKSSAPDSVFLREACTWEVSSFPDRLVFRTQQSVPGASYALVRQIELVGRHVVSFTQLANTGSAPLPVQWFPHPFWALTDRRATLRRETDYGRLISAIALI